MIKLRITSNNKIYLNSIYIGDIIDTGRIYVEKDGQNWYIRDKETKDVLVLLTTTIYSKLV